MAGIFLLLSIGYLSACKPWTVRPINHKKMSGESSQGFNSAAYVASVWESRVIPTVVNNAVDLATLLAALEADPEAAKRQYGRKEATGPYHFIVRGEGVVREGDSGSRSRTVAVDLSGYKGKAKVLIQVGPVIRGTSIRDAVGFIKFDQFINQLQYAEVADKLNDRALASIGEGLDLSAVKGKQVSFYGVFTLSDPSKVLITPVKLEWREKR